MKKREAKDPTDPDLLDEYDFSEGTRGKYAERYASGSNIVVLDPDVAEIFPDSASANEALRALATIIRKQQRGAAKDG